jgi:eukaryotic-like serine/threonine-protein kinase
MGEVFAGRYELVDVLGSGGAGTVWRAWDRREHAYRAAKVLRQSDGDSLLRFVRETSRHVQHPHVIAPYGWTGEDDRVLFTMPLVRGGSVATLLGDYGVIPLGWAVELLRQSLQALVEVHRVGLVHRDVKPANLLLDATGRGHPHLMLSDFGAAAQLGAPRLTQADTVIGTPGYFAPEQLAGADPAPTQDIYAAAVVMTQMVSGTAPTRAGDLAPMRRDGATSAGVADLVDAMTAHDPERRPGTALEALGVLDAVPGAHDLALGSDATDPVEVFDHVPPLPPGWGEDGPLPGPDRRATRERPTPAPQEHLEPAPTLHTARTMAAPRASTPRWRAVPVLAWWLVAAGLLLILAAIVVG